MSKKIELSIDVETERIITIISGATFCLTRPVNSRKKKGRTYLDIVGRDPNTGMFSRVRLSARQLNYLKTTILV